MIDLKAFASGLVLAGLCLFLICLAMDYANVAPVFSSNPSFNKKAAYLRGSDGSCEVVTLGSSMALSNVDGGLLAHGTGYRVQNLGYWGASPAESLSIYKLIRETCVPKVLLLPLQYSDFSAEASDGKNIADWWAYVKSSSPLLVAKYYWLKLAPTLSQFIELHHQIYTTRRDYYSLAYDSTGGVLLDCDGFHISRARWDSYKRRPQGPLKKQKEEQLLALRGLLQMARDDATRVIIVRSPLRPQAEQELGHSENDPLWGSVKQLASEYSARLVFVQNSGTFSDNDFVDYSHLNKCGAEKLTQQLLPSLR